jgi:hypothetical protein
MRVDDLVALLCEYARKHGPDAQIAVPRFPSFDSCGEEIYLDQTSIWTVLASRGETVKW